MIPATKQPPPARRCAGGRYARLDEEYLLEIRPHLTDSEARVYELLVLKCDGWKRPSPPNTIAALARIHLDTVRRAMRRLEEMGLIHSQWSGARRSPTSERTVEIVRDYRRARLVLDGGQAESSGEPVHGIQRSRDMGSADPIGRDRAIPSHLIARSLTRSDPDPSSLPSSQVAQAGGPVAQGIERRTDAGGLGASAVRSAAEPSATDVAHADLATPTVAEPTTRATMGDARLGDAAGRCAELLTQHPDVEADDLRLGDDEDTGTTAEICAASADVEPDDAQAEPSTSESRCPSVEARSTRHEHGAADHHAEEQPWIDAVPCRSDPAYPSLAEYHVPAVAALEWLGNAKRVAANPGCETVPPPTATRYPSPSPTNRLSQADALTDSAPLPTHDAVPSELVELVELARALWGPNVAYKAARRYLGRLLSVGEPAASLDEVARYLRWSARLSRVQRAGFPIAVVCVAEEFADWLKRYRQSSAIPKPATPAPLAASTPTNTLTKAELGHRASELCARLFKPRKCDAPGSFAPHVIPQRLQATGL